MSEQKKRDQTQEQTKEMTDLRDVLRVADAVRHLAPRVLDAEVERRGEGLARPRQELAPRHRRPGLRLNVRPQLFRRHARVLC